MRSLKPGSGLSDKATLYRAPRGSAERSAPAANGMRLRELLGDRDYAWLSRETGIPISTLSDYTRGVIPRTDKALLLAKALGTSVEGLFLGAPADRPDDDPAVTWLPWHASLKTICASHGAGSSRLPLPTAWLDAISREPETLWLTMMPTAVSGIGREGDILLCQHVEGNLVDGRAYVIMINGHPVVRRVTVTVDGVLLLPVDGLSPGISLGSDEIGPSGRVIPIARLIAVISSTPV